MWAAEDTQLYHDLSGHLDRRVEGRPERREVICNGEYFVTRNKNQNHKIQDTYVASHQVLIGLLVTLPE